MASRKSSQKLYDPSVSAYGSTTNVSLNDDDDTSINFRSRHHSAVELLQDLKSYSSKNKSNVAKFKTRHNFIRLRLSRFLDHTSSVGLVLDSIEVGLSVLFTSVYVYNTYIPDEVLLPSLWMIELACATMFLLDYIFRRILLAKSPTGYLMSFKSIINLAIIIPVIPVSFALKTHTLWFGNGYWRLIFPARFLKCYNEVTNLISRMHQALTPVTQFVIKTYVLILCVVLTAAGVIQIAETSSADDDDDGTQWTFFSCFFNSVLVFATIGSPPADNNLARVFVGALAIVLVIIVPYQISKLIDLSASYSSYEITTVTSSNVVVLSGSLSSERIMQFFNEMFHVDHDVVDLRVVVLSPEEPTSNLKQLLHNPFYQSRVSFLKGSILNESDAFRASVHHASAVFIMSQKSGQADVMSSDHQTFMRCAAARRYSSSSSNNEVQIYAQLHLSSSRHLLESIGVQHIVCFSEISHSILAQNITCPGFSTLLYNLTSSSKNLTSDNDHNNTKSDSWIRQYEYGTDQEVYAVTLPSSDTIFGMTFANLALHIYNECPGVVCFAVLQNSILLLNPGTSYKCIGDEVAFVMASDRKEADSVSCIKCTTVLSNNTVKVSLPSSITDFVKPVMKKRTLENAVISSAYDLETSVNNFRPLVVIFLSKNTWPRDTQCFLSTLRSANEQRLYSHVVFGVSTLPNKSEWEDDIGDFNHDNLFIVTGDVFSTKMLKNKLALDKAFRIVLVCGEGTTPKSENLLDASTLAVYTDIVSIIGKSDAPSVLVEVIDKSSFDYVSYNLECSTAWFDSTTKNQKSKVSRAFASGVVYSSSLCDSLLINSFFNPMISAIVRELMFASTLREVERSTSLEENTTSTCSLYTQNVPENLVGSTYGDVFKILVRNHNILPLGIYRCVSNNKTTTAPPYGFVYTNPRPSEVVRTTDLLYVLKQ